MQQSQHTLFLEKIEKNVMTTKRLMDRIKTKAFKMPLEQ
jgi:hypothetical protein